jgi:hypothetical protein
MKEGSPLNREIQTGNATFQQDFPTGTSKEEKIAHNTQRKTQKTREKIGDMQGTGFE